MPNIKVADLIAEAAIKSDKMQRELNELRRTTDRQTDRMSDEFKKVEREGNRAFSRLGQFAKRTIQVGIVAALGAMTAAIVKSVRTSANFETLQLRLEQLAGSAELGKQRFQELVEFSARTPFQLGEIIEAEASLKSFGDTNKESIKAMGDLAVFMGVTLPEAASAYGRAFAGGAGAADIFRERGVLNLIKMESGIDDLTKLTLPEFRRAMTEAFTDPNGRISGGTAKLANTLAGRWSTFKDNANLSFKAVGDAMKTELLTTLNTLISRVGQFIDSGRAESLGKNIAKGISLAVTAMEKLSEFFTTSTEERIAEINDEINRLQSNIDNLNSPLNRLFGQNTEERVERYERRIRQLRHELSVLKGEIEPLGPPAPEATAGGAGVSPDVTPSDIIDFDKLKDRMEKFNKDYKDLETKFFEEDMNDVMTDAGEMNAEAYEKAYQEKLAELRSEEGIDSPISEENIQAAARVMDAFVDGLIDARNFTLDLGQAFKSFASQAVAELERVIAKLIIIQTLKAFGVPGQTLSLLGFQLGGSAVQGHDGKPRRAQLGFDGIVPSGFTENFPIVASAGERVSVAPVTRAGDEAKLLGKIGGKLDSLNYNVARLGARQANIEAQVNVKDRDLQLMVEQSQRREGSFR